MHPQGSHQQTQNQPYDPYYSPEPWVEPQPAYIPVDRRRRGSSNQPPSWMRPRRRGIGCCFPLFFLSGLFLLLLAVYLFFPARTNVLILGIDYTEPGSAVGRSDTIILSTFVPLSPYVGMLSIPRDLWVLVPGMGENRINTAHFFAESQRMGSGPYAVLETVRFNFGVDVNYFVRIRFEGFREVVNAMGGVDIDLPTRMAGYEAGRHHLTGNKALAFARHRQGSDDFFRMEQGQLIMKAVMKQMLNPVKWPRLPFVLLALAKSVDTNLPFYLWPRLATTLLIVGPDGIDNRTIRREMVAPFTTNQGANVLAPDWNQINPVLMDIFGQ